MKAADSAVTEAFLAEILTPERLAVVTSPSIRVTRSARGAPPIANG